MASVGADRPLKRADPGTIQDKFLVGYQGWFTCAGDGPPIDPGHHGWLHWISEPLSSPTSCVGTDLWPDVSAYSPSELYPCTGLEMKSGEQALLFSSRNPKTVQKHFRWMAEHGVDGAFLQRFGGQIDLEHGNHGIRRLRDEVGECVRLAAEKEGRVFAIMYDLSGLGNERIQRVIEQDWMHLVREKKILDSPSYLKEKGRPVIALWGLGFEGRGYEPATIRALAQFLRTHTPGGAYLMAGTPAYWRECTGDADSNPEWIKVFLEDFDAISPWSVGRYHNEESADHYADKSIKGDLELIRKRNQEVEMAGQTKKVDYLPVVFPGFSGVNMSKGDWKFNSHKRNGGRFLWRQLWNARRQGVRMVYGAMWDEYDEGTAFMPVVASKRELPKSDKWQFLALDADGYDLPTDWYMRICGFGAEGLRGERFIHETFPVKELQDYWAHRPRYEDPSAPSGSGGSASAAAGSSAGGSGQSFQDWEATQGGKGDDEEPPPPPYSLEADALAAAAVDGAPAVASRVSPAPPQTSLSTRPPGAHGSGAPPIPASRPTSSPAAPLAPLSTRPFSPPNSVPPLSAVTAPHVSDLASGLSGVTISSPSHHGPGTGGRPADGPSFPPSNPTSSALFSFPEPSRGGTPQASDGQWSQAQWPPTEWNTPTSSTNSGYPGMTSGLGRSHSANAYGPSYSGTQHAPSPPGRPTSQGSGNPGLGRSQSANAYGPSYAGAQPVSGLQNTPTLPPRPSSHGSGSVSGVLNMPTAIPSPSHSPQPLHSPVSMAFSSDGSASSPMQQATGNQYGGYFHGQPQPQHPGSQPQPYAPSSFPYQTYGAAQSKYGAPQAPSPDARPSAPTNTRPGSASGYPGSSPPQQGYFPHHSQSSGWNQYGQASGPHSQAPPAVPLRPQGQGPPDPPPRPGNSRPGSLSYYPQPQPQPQPGPSSGYPAGPAAPILSSAPVNMALGAVERFASQNTRRQIEKGVEGLAQTGSKFFQKFNK